MARHSTSLKATSNQSIVQVNQPAEDPALVDGDDLGTENISQGKKRKLPELKVQDLQYFHGVRRLGEY